MTYQIAYNPALNNAGRMTELLHLSSVTESSAINTGYQP